MFLKKTTIFIIIQTFFFVNIGNGQILNNNQYKKEFQQARHVFHRVYFEKASLLFEKLLLKEPDHALTYAYAAMLDYMLYRDPAININKAKSIMDENDLFTKALIYFVDDDLSNCEATLKQFLQKYPDDPYASHVLGFTQIDMGRPEDGLKTLSSLTKSQPQFYPALNHLGYAHLKLSQNNLALESFELFLKSDSLNPSAFDSYADALEQIEEYDKAIAQLIKAILIEPGFAYGWMHMGDILHKTGALELATHAYKKAQESAKFYGDSFINSLDKKLLDISSNIQQRL